ncbi:MAG TPA: type II toxin-antitoxin system VapC family toxin [Terriglobia bacterium]|nr:type II toxin-antitoxin system VapC family toxin [Terriglobia bacterium]
MRYILNTDICIYIAKQRPASVQSRLRRLQPGDVGMSVITFLELVYGAWKSQQFESNLERIEQLRTVIPALPLDSEAARHYGRLRTDLERKESPIGAYDLLIAAHALSEDLTLVTNNVREFSRVDGLRVENWAL